MIKRTKLSKNYSRPPSYPNRSRNYYNWIYIAECELKFGSLENGIKSFDYDTKSRSKCIADMIGVVNGTHLNSRHSFNIVKHFITNKTKQNLTSIYPFQFLRSFGDS